MPELRFLNAIFISTQLNESIHKSSLFVFQVDRVTQISIIIKNPINQSVSDYVSVRRLRRKWYNGKI